MLTFDDGARLILNSGINGTCFFALSTKPVEGTGSHKAADKLSEAAGHGIGEITGTGYGRQSQTAPPASGATGRLKAFTQMEWRTDSHTDWPASVKSVVLVIGSTAVCAWNLRAGGTARDLSAASTIERATPTYELTG